MIKRKVLSIQVLFEDGEIRHYNNSPGKLLGTFSESRNARKAGGFKNLEEWTEYHITWISPINIGAIDVPSVEQLVNEITGKQDREALRGKAWCSVHNMEPGDCFSQHVVPTAFSGREPNWSSVVNSKPTEVTLEMFDKAVEGIKKQPVTLDFGLDGFLGDMNGQS